MAVEQIDKIKEKRGAKGLSDKDRQITGLTTARTQSSDGKKSRVCCKTLFSCSSSAFLQSHSNFFREEFLCGPSGPYEVFHLED